MPIWPLLMAECERVKPSGNPCRIRTSFVSLTEIPEHWRRIDGALTCNICLRELEPEEETREIKRP